MLNFREYIETSFNVTDYTPMLGNPESAVWRGIGAVGGIVPAALSGAVPATGALIGALRTAKRRAFISAGRILDYSIKNPRVGELVLDKVDQVIDKVERSGEMGVVSGGALPTVNPYSHSTLKDVGAALWKGITTSAMNLFDTLFGPRASNDKSFLGFREVYKSFFQALGSLPRDKAFPLLKNFAHVLSLHGTGNELDKDVWLA